MNEDERMDRLEEIVVLLKTLIVRHQERLDSQETKVNSFETDLRRSREDFEFKLNALIDAQLRNEEGISELRASIGDLRDESKSQLRRLEKLERTS